MKRLSILIVMLLVIAIPVCSFAFAYTDSENQLNIDIPEGENIYYYTPTGTNLFSDLLEQLQNTGQDVRLLIRSYTPENILGYSLEVVAAPAPGAGGGGTEEPAESGPEQTLSPEEAAIATPSPSADADAFFADVTAFPTEELEELADQVKQDFSEMFSLGDATAASVGGIPALMLEGTGIENTDWANYDCTVYLLSNQDHLLTVTLTYDNTDNAAYKNAAQAMLATITFGPPPEPTPAPSPEPTPVPTLEPTVAPTPVPTPAPTPAPTGVAGFFAGIADFFSGIGDSITNAYLTDPNFIYYVIGLLVILAVVILVILLARYKRNEKRAGEERPEPLGEEPWPDEAPGRTRRSGTGATGTLSPSSTQQTGEDHSFHPAADRPDGLPFTGKDADYSGDVSRYTRQPGREVNDVSRYTQGGYLPGDEAMRSTGKEDGKNGDADRTEADVPAASPGKRQSVGSRVERNRRKKRK